MNEDTCRIVFHSWFGLTNAEARLLARLFMNGGRAASASALAQALRTTEAHIKVMVCGLRQTLDPETLDCERGAGYALTEVGMGECRGALWTIGEELRRVG